MTPATTVSRSSTPTSGFWRDFLTERELQHIRARYRAEASMVDHWLGVLLNKLDVLGLTEDTAVIFSSDHGYLFGEHDLIGKSLLVDTGGARFTSASGSMTRSGVTH